jgi:hypothetical protein
MVSAGGRANLSAGEELATQRYRPPVANLKFPGNLKLGVF